MKKTSAATMTALMAPTTGFFFLLELAVFGVVISSLSCDGMVRWRRHCLRVIVRTSGRRSEPEIHTRVPSTTASLIPVLASSSTIRSGSMYSSNGWERKFNPETDSQSIIQSLSLSRSKLGCWHLKREIETQVVFASQAHTSHRSK